mgnify:CR=1 FL=1
MMGERGDVLLLAAQRDDGLVLAGLQVEDPRPGFTDGSGDEEVRIGEIE